jgi:uncharacterized protein (TIGR02444 family)
MHEHTQTFWDYSLALYAHSDVERCCLALQEDDGADVNLLLLCCWCSDNGLEPGSQWFRDIQTNQVLQQWREQTIVPLRELRRQLKISAMPGAQSLRMKIKALELAAEKRQQDYLLQLLPHPTAGERGPVLAWSNLQAYWQSIGRDDLSGIDIAPLLRAAYPDCSAVELRGLLAV